MNPKTLPTSRLKRELTGITKAFNRREYSTIFITRNKKVVEVLVAPWYYEQMINDVKLLEGVNLPVNEVQDVTQEVLKVLGDTLNTVSDNMEPESFNILLDKLHSGEYSVIRKVNKQL